MNTDDLAEAARRLLAAILCLAVLEARAGDRVADRWLHSPWARRLCDGLRGVDPEALTAWRRRSAEYDRTWAKGGPHRNRAGYRRSPFRTYSGKP